MAVAQQVFDNLPVVLADQRARQVVRRRGFRQLERSILHLVWCTPSAGCSIGRCISRWRSCGSCSTRFSALCAPLMPALWYPQRAISDRMLARASSTQRAVNLAPLWPLRVGLSHPTEAGLTTVEPTIGAVQNHCSEPRSRIASCLSWSGSACRTSRAPVASPTTAERPAYTRAVCQLSPSGR